jgi:ERF superfamily
MSNPTVTKPKKEKPLKEVAIIESTQQAVVLHDKSSPDNMILLALEKGMDIGVIERLMKMKNEEQARIAKMEYLQAMVRFQGVLPDLQKNRKVDYESKAGGKVKYNYQDLGSIIKMIRKPLEECGLFYRWEQTEKENIVTVVCILSHIGGHEERGAALTGALDTSGNKAGLHAKASTITYLQRYTLKGILGLTSTETDDDGLTAIRKDQGEIVSNKPKMEGSQLNGAIKLILEGKETVDSLSEKWNLTDGQVQALTKTQESLTKQ